MFVYTCCLANSWLYKCICQHISSRSAPNTWPSLLYNKMSCHVHTRQSFKLLYVSITPVGSNCNCQLLCNCNWYCWRCPTVANKIYTHTWLEWYTVLQLYWLTAQLSSFLILHSFLENGLIYYYKSQVKSSSLNCDN